MFYNFIGENKDEIISDVQCFFYHVIKDNFPDKSCEYILYMCLVILYSRMPISTKYVVHPTSRS